MADEQTPAQEPVFQLPVNLRVRRSDPTAEVFMTSHEPYVNVALYLPDKMMDQMKSGRYTLSFAPASAPPPPTEKPAEQGSSGEQGAGGAAGSETTE